MRLKIPSIILRLMLVLCPVFILSSAHTPTKQENKFVLVIHGGAGFMDPAKADCEENILYTDKLKEALRAGENILQNGGTSVEAIQAAIIILENSPLFNAGKGSVFTHEGKNEMDASIMDGSTLKAGAVSGIIHIKNPILLAKEVMYNSNHVMLSGLPAEEFAKQQKLEIVDAKYFFTEKRWESLKRAKERASKKEKHGTVGAVALDKHGNLAAATSTGGMTNKRFGRIGDSPIIGAGTYANNLTCAVSCTGHGEYFIRNVVAYDVSARMMYGKQTLAEATEAIIHKFLKDQGGTGGLISVDKNGNISMPFNTTGMYRGYVKSDGKIEVKIY